MHDATRCSRCLEKTCLVGCASLIGLLVIGRDFDNALMSKICGSSQKTEWGKKKDFCGLVGHFEEIWSRQPEDDFGNEGRDKKIVDINEKNKELEGTILKLK